MATPEREETMRIVSAQPAVTAPRPVVENGNGYRGKRHGVDAQSDTSSARDLLALIRPHQWIKNGFVAAPLFLTPWAWGWETVGATSLGMLAFCLVASAVYIMNDYVDREADRKHPRKRHRPLAAKRVSVQAAFLMMGLLLVSGLAVAFSLSVPFVLILAAYFGLNVGYSMGLKDVAIADVLIIAGGFVLRVEAGATLIAVATTHWITIMMGLLALFIALGKRRDDLINSMTASHRPSLEGYNKAFLDNAMTAVLGALLVTYLIYTTDADVMVRMESEQLFYTAPFVAAGIMRYLQLMFVEKRSGDPTGIALTDRFLQGTIVGWALCFALLLYA